METADTIFLSLKNDSQYNTLSYNADLMMKCYFEKNFPNKSLTKKTLKILMNSFEPKAFFFWRFATKILQYYYNLALPK